jgi:hypothetical protein
MYDNQSKCSGCVKETSEQLEKFKGELVIVVKKNTFIYGTIIDVKNSVLVLEDAMKITTFGNVVIQIKVNNLFESICDITKFIPLELAFRSELLENLNRINSIKLL